MAALEYGIFDCHTHCYEPRDACTRYLPKEFLDRALTPVIGAAGKEIILAGHRVATFNSEQGLGFDFAYRPGSLKEMLRQMATGNPLLACQLSNEIASARLGAGIPGGPGCRAAAHRTGARPGPPPRRTPPDQPPAVHSVVRRLRCGRPCERGPRCGRGAAAVPPGR